MAGNAELALLELEERFLDMVDQAWEVYQEQGAGLPPMTLVNLMEKAHRIISGRLKAKLGSTFDPDNPEASLIQIERIRDLIVKQIEQKSRARVMS